MSRSNGATGPGRAADESAPLVSKEGPILITGASGFMGPRVVENLAARGFRNLRCLLRPSSDFAKMQALARGLPKGVQLEMMQGNLLSPQDCEKITQGVPLIYHLAAGRGEKSIPEAFMNSVVTTRNLLEAARGNKCLKRFVSISSFSVYSNDGNPEGNLLDESCPMETRPERRGDAYSFAKVKQDELVMEYGDKFQLPYVIVRPGVVYGPGNESIHGRVGIGTFGVFLHLGGSNSIPFTYVDNCAEAIVLAGLKRGVEREIFNVVDDNLPTSRQFLRQYKKRVKQFRSVYVPKPASYLLTMLWEKYSDWSEGQLPAVYNRRAWRVYWKRTRYSNQKLKARLGWQPKVTASEAMSRHFESCKLKVQHA